MNPMDVKDYETLQRDRLPDEEPLENPGWNIAKFALVGGVILAIFVILAVAF
jgi:hypothetical protein